MDDVLILRLENRMRVIVKELLEPTSRRATEAIDSIEKLTNRFEALFIRVEDTEVVQLKTLSKLGIMEEYNKRLMEFSANQTLIESRMQKDKQEFFTQFYSLSSVLNGVKEEVDVFEKEKQTIKEDITAMSHNLMDAKFDLEQKVAAFKDDYHERLNGLEDRILRAEIDTVNFGKKAKKIVSELEDVSNQIEIHNRNFEEANGYTRRVENKVDSYKVETVSNLEILRAGSIKINTEIIKIEKLVGSVREGIGKVQEEGVKNFWRITEPLYRIFQDPPTQRIIAAYDLERMETVTSQESAKMIDAVRENAKKIMEAELPAPKPVESKKKKKKPKILTSKKKEEQTTERAEKIQTTEKKAQNIDFRYQDETIQGQSYIRTIPKPAHKQSEDFSNIHSINQVLSPNNPQKPLPNSPSKPKKQQKSSSSSSSENSSDSSSPLIIPEQIDYSPMITKLKSELQDEFSKKIQSLSDHTSVQLKIFSDSLSKIDSDVRAALQKTVDSVDITIKETAKKISDIELIAQQVMYECTSQLSNRKRENNDFHFELKTLKDKTTGIAKQVTTVIESVEAISNKLALLIEFNLVNHTLQSQDESDRESIALMGYKEVKPGKGLKMHKAAVSIDKQCFSCTGQSSVVLNAFKIACLAYTPSPVFWQNEKFSRKELLEYLKKMLEGIKNGKIENLLDRRQRAVSTTMKNYRPVSVPTQQASPRSEYIDMELPKKLRKSINL